MLAFDPAEHAHGDIYKLMIGAIVPRPIALVSSIDRTGIRNLAPFSYFTACSSNPPVVVFCPILRPVPPTAKDTLRNVAATQEFVVNIVSEEFVERMNATAATVAPEVAQDSPERRMRAHFCRLRNRFDNSLIRTIMAPSG